MTPHNLPQHWQNSTLGEIFDIERGGSPRPIQDYLTDDTNGINWIKIGDVRKGEKYITSTKQKIKIEGLKKSRKINIGDLLLTNSMSYGIPFISNIEGAIHDGWIVLKPKITISKEYVFYFLSSQKAYQYFDNKASGSTVRNLQINYVKDTPIPLPPLEIQREIVEILESKLEKITSAKAILESSLKKCETYRLSLLNDAFSGNLTPHSKDWQWVTLKDIGTIITGSTPSKANQEFYGDDYPLFKPTDLESGYYTQNARDKVSLLGFQQGREIPPKSTLVTCIGATIGKTGFTRTKGICNQQINAIIPDKKQVIEEFVYFYCISPLFQSQILSNYHSTTLPILKKSLFERLSIPLPPLEIQREIVEILESKLEKIKEAKALLESSLQECETYRLSLLESAFRGELV